MKIYHILLKNQWLKAKKIGFYAPPSLEKVGFIHCATKGQVIPTANRRFQKKKNLILLAINPGKVKARIIYENLSGKGEKHPHIYGKLSLKAIESVSVFKPEKDGSFKHFPKTHQKTKKAH